jgi:beta-galactosidase
MDDIEVPGTWQMQGYGYKVYRNIPLEFGPYNPPRVPDHLNPTGIYIRDFFIPESWDNREIFIHFEGVKSACWLWINGQYVGFDKGSMTSGEWNISDFVNVGNNRIAVKVVRWSDGTYLEDQDMWRFSGIYRDVYLQSRPKVHVRDLSVQPDLDQSYKNGELNIQAFYRNADSIEQNEILLDVELLDPEGKSVLTKNMRLGTMLADDEKEVEISLKIDDPLKWSAEKPDLYTLLLITRHPDEEIVEVIEEKIGFRKIEIKEAQLLINGVAVKFKGVNRHEHDPDKGRTMTREMIEMDMKLMKQLNVNAIRTSHYPNDPLFYDLADQYGFYICDEVNAECHEGEDYLAGQPGWETAFMDRTERFFHRDKNHPSVILWSTGNECGYGPYHDEMAGFLKENDPTRPVYHQGNAPNGDAPFADVNGIRYPTPEHLRMVGRNTDRPVIMGEYSHAMGNGLGGFDEYWEVIYSEKSLQGGFIWDWVNQGLLFDLRTTPDGSKYQHQAVLMGNVQSIDGVDGKGVALSGVDDFIEIYNHPVFDRIGDGLSLEAWIYPRGFYDVSPLISKGLSFEITQEYVDSLTFSLSIGQRIIKLSGYLPKNWDYNWHHVIGIYDGSEMKLFLDGLEIASNRVSGLIDRSPHPVCIGKNHKKNHENRGWFIANYLFDKVRIFSGIIDPLSDSNREEETENAELLLSLDFEEFSDEGTFLSYGATPQGSGTMDGVVDAYRKPQPEAFQMKQSHAPVHVEKIGRDMGQLRIHNRFHFTPLSEIDILWELWENDKSVGSGNLKLSTLPQESEVIALPFKRPRFKMGADYVFRISFRLKKKNDWAERQHEYCFFEMSVENLEEQKDFILQEETSGFSVEEDENSLKISANDIYYEIDLATGNIRDLTNDGTRLIMGGPTFNVWRKPVMNEWSEWGINEAAFWYKYGFDSLVHRVVDVEKYISGFDAYLDFNIESRSFNFPELVFHQHVIYNVFSTGDLVIHHKVNADIDPPNLYANDWFPIGYLQKIGLRLKLSENIGSANWYGPGPFETYPDRKTGAKTGIHEERIDEIQFPYLIVQDFNNHTDVRWMALKSDDGKGILITCSDHFNFSIDPYNNLNEAWYPFQLTRTENPVLNLDYLVTGLGGTPVRVRPKYRTYPSEYEYRILIRPFSRNPDFFELSNIEY